MTINKNYAVEDNVTRCSRCHNYFVDQLEGENCLCDKCANFGDELDEINQGWANGEYTL